MAHQDTRFPKFKKINVTEIYWDFSLFQERVKNLNTKALVVIRGLPGTGKSEVVKSLNVEHTFNMSDYLHRDDDDDYVVYTHESMKKAHIEIRKQIKKLLSNSKFNSPIVISAPHSYLWELKHYKAQSCQYNVPLIIYEHRTLFSKDVNVRTEQLSDIKMNEMITTVSEWLSSQMNHNSILPTQKNLLNYLRKADTATLAVTKPKNNSFCPNVLLNIQLAAWLTHRCNNGVYMDFIWTLMEEWEEISNEESLWKNVTPKWGW